MSLNKYNAFIKVSELGSITRAADALGYSQPSISQMIDSLEKEFGFPLLIRERDAFRPTENGEKILYYCYQIVNNEAMMMNTVSSINGLMTGTLRIAGLHSMTTRFLPPVLEEFHKLYPALEVYLLELNGDEMSDRLNKGLIDIAFTSQEELRAFKVAPLFEDPCYVIFPDDHPLASYEEVPVSMLNHQNMIMQIEGWNNAFETITLQQKFHPEITCHTADGSDRTGIELVARGFGMYLLQKIHADHLPEHVIARPLEGNPHRTMGYAVKNRKQMPPAVKELVRIAEKNAELFR